MPIDRLRARIEAHEHHFAAGGRLHRLRALWEAAHTFLFTPGEVTRSAPHVRDALDLKRVMMTVVVALAGCTFMAMYNTGRQAHEAIAAGALPLDAWQTRSFAAMGLGFDPSSVLACTVHGSLYYLPVLVVTLVFGGAWEAVFAIARKHAINEGFFVTWMLFPLILPATIPLWQVALGISFGVVVGKELFGGTGMNILNPALVARAFLFFAYPAEISGDAVWIAARTLPTDVVTGATPLAGLSEAAAQPTWWTAFVGLVPGSMGETSALACLAGAALLVVTGIGSWRIMLGVTLGTVGAAACLNAIGGANPVFAMPFWWHFVLGGWAFGAVFMATDPVTAAHTQTGRWIYGLLIGVLVVLVRALNPGYPEGMMFAILLANVFAASIDHVVVAANVRRRERRRRAR